MLIYRTQFLLPVASPLVVDAAVGVENGRIVSAGPAAPIVAQAGDGDEIRDLGRTVLLPGLVNAHTHIELSWMGQTPPIGGSFAEWVGNFLDLREGEEEARAEAAAEQAIRTLVSRGTVAVGDVCNRTWVAPMLARSGLHGVVFHELLGFRSEDAERIVQEAVERLEEIAAHPDMVGASHRLLLALTPHAPHTTSVPLLRALAGRATASNEPLSIHLAESPEEVALLANGSGPLRPLFEKRRFWDDGWDPPGQTPVEYLDRLGALTERTLGVHCVHLEQHDHSKLQSRGVAVVTCPRSNRTIGVGTAPVPKLLAEGIPVALGTDSLASCGDLDLFAEIAALREEHPTLAPAAVLRMATLNGARALGLADRLGTIEAGKLARLIAIPLDEAEDDPLDAVCSVPETVHPLEHAPWEAAS